MTSDGRNIDDTIEARTHLWHLIKDVRFAMFTTRHPAHGHLHSRPLTTQNKSVDEDDSLWFFVARTSETVADVQQEPTVNVAYADPHKDCYVSVSGTAAVVDDLAKKQALWGKLNEAWFPAGPTDPNLALIQVRIVHASYWDVDKSQIVQLFQMAKAAFTGKPLQGMGTEATVHMR